MHATLTEAQRRQLKTEGFCIVPDVLSPEEVKKAKNALGAAADAMQQHGVPTHTASIDPNACNVRVYNLPEMNPLFMELLRHPVALALAKEILGPNVLVSNFTANIALPGARSMRLHSDQALVIPPPWHQPWAMNVIWCLDNAHDRNGATRYLPGSHRYENFSDVPPGSEQKTLPFEAPAGSVIAMEGRLWHTSGANVTENEDRALMFAYYSTDFIRPQANWESALSPETKSNVDNELRQLLGLGPAANIRIGGKLTRLQETDNG
jgi:ectoine hydroxylase-related dioxygenase (phytanoyl-CoA dioxygenase family)